MRRGLQPGRAGAPIGAGTARRGLAQALGDQETAGGLSGVLGLWRRVTRGRDARRPFSSKILLRDIQMHCPNDQSPFDGPTSSVLNFGDACGPRRTGPSSVLAPPLTSGQRPHTQAPSVLRGHARGPSPHTAEFSLTPSGAVLIFTTQ